MNKTKQIFIDKIVENVDNSLSSKRSDSQYFRYELELREAIRYHRQNPIDTELGEKFEEVQKKLLRIIRKIFDNRRLKIDNFEVTGNQTTQIENDPKELEFLISMSMVGIEKFDREKVRRDIGLLELEDCVSQFRSKKVYKNVFLGPLNHPGVSSRWKHYLRFICEKLNNKNITSSKQIFINFTNYLGRVTTYRALALEEVWFERIIEEGTILCTGRLSSSKETIRHSIYENGIMKICYDRLYMRHVIDPSLSVHDDPETTVCIASNFLIGETSSPKKHVFLFELNLPVIETIGFAVNDVQFEKKSWFLYGGVYFDSTKFTTERYMLDEIPFLENTNNIIKLYHQQQKARGKKDNDYFGIQREEGKRLRSIRKFRGKEDILKFIEPFRKRQKKKHDLDVE